MRGRWPSPTPVRPPQLAISPALGLALLMCSSDSSLVHNLGLDDALSDDGAFITVAGYASLVDPLSARSTTPSLQRFRYGTIRGYRRVFNLVSIVNIRRGLATGRHLTTATARPCDGALLRVCLFDVPVAELPELLARERRLRVSCAPYFEDDECILHASEAPSGRHALLFTEYSHAEYLRERCGGDPAIYHEEVGQWYAAGEIYRSDLLPVPSYVLRCVRAHRAAGSAALANLFDASVLADGQTSLRAHLRRELADAEASPAATCSWSVAEREELLAALEDGEGL